MTITIKFLHLFDITFHAEPWELKNTLMCQLWHVERLRVKETYPKIDTHEFAIS